MKFSQFVKIGIIVLSSAPFFTFANQMDKISWAQPAYSLPLETVSSVVNALNHGATVNATVDLSLCTPQDGGHASTTKGGLKVTPFRVQGDGTLSFSDPHFTVSTSTQQPLMQYLRYKVVPAGGITVTSFIFSVPDYNLINQVSYDCAINNGVSFYIPY
jgi:hypothetical protein